MQPAKFTTSIIQSKWLPVLVSLLAFVIFILRAVHLSHYLNVNMDEGAYLIKGLLVTDGVYAPYQFFGPWLQKMPLAYFLFGLAQQFFGPGLGIGRAVSLVFAALMLPGVWILTTRLGGAWAGALALTYLALNQAGLIKVAYATTQAQVACYGVWMAVLTVGFRPKPWQAVLGGVLAGLMVITRQNMLPYAALWAVYLFWTQARKTAWIALAACAFVFLIPHILFWPNILSLWTLLPRPLTPFLDPWRITENVTYYDQWNPAFAVQFDAIWEAVRYYFISFTGVIFSLLLAPLTKRWPNELAWKTYVFLATSWFTLLAIHFTTSFFMNYGFYTFSGYIAFFDHLALAIIALTFRFWRQTDSLVSRFVVGAAALTIPPTAAFIAHTELGIIITWLKTPLPRFRFFEVVPGSTNLVGILIYKLGLKLETLNWLLPTLAGVLVGIMVLILAILIKRKTTTTSLAGILAVVFMSVGLVFTPSPVLGRGHADLLCRFDVLAADGSTGKETAAMIPPGATVFWYPWLSPTPLLWLENARLFPPQFDDYFTFVKGGEPNKIEKYGFWNEALARQWLLQTDYVLIMDTSAENGRNVDDFNTRFGDLVELRLISTSHLPINCSNRESWSLIIFKPQLK